MTGHPFVKNTVFNRTGSVLDDVLEAGLLTTNERNSHMANVVFSSNVEWTGTGVQSDATSGQHVIRIDEPESLGGTNTGPNPVELILSALGGCLVVLVNAFAPAHNVMVKAVSIKVEGDLDPDGFMGKSDVRPGFSAIRYALDVASDSATEDIAALIAHVERSCPVKDTLEGVSVGRM
jgi:uncharacterized OsmC-like protein